MKTTKHLLTASMLFVMCIAQAQNPWEKYGYNPPKPLTLSDGQYEEFFTNDTIVQIGSVMFNTVTNQVVAFLETEIVYSEATLKPEVISRFLSPDPLEKQFPMLTPYQYASNRPIDGIDIDGLEHASYTVKLNSQGKTLQTVETSRYIHDVGQKGWGTQYTFVDEKGNKVFQVFKQSDPPLIWTGADRPLYVSGVKVLGKYDELEGSEGFKHGGWQTMVSTLGLFFGATELALATKGAQIAWGIASVAASTDDLISAGGKSLSENILGEGKASGAINLSKSALSFRAATLSTLEQINKGADAAKSISTLVDTYGGIENFQKAYESFSSEVQKAMQPETEKKE